MIANISYNRILLRTILLFASLAVVSFFLVKGWYLWSALISPFLVYQMVEFFRFQKKTHEEVSQFLEAVHYRDFSRYFDVKHASADIQPLRQGFNEINSTFKVISKEKETQYQYLQKILELVDTGILSYDVESGEVIWMNETLKRMLEVPYLKTLQSLNRRDQLLYEEIKNISPAETKIVTIHLEKSTFKALLSASAFQINNKKSKLIAFQNVNEALDETESKAWQKLLSVMTHEIMNSVAPISSLAETLKNRLQLASPQLEDDAVEDLELGIDTIKRRSEGLLKFAETYRSLNKITKLNLKKIYVRELFANLHQLMQPTFEQKGTELEIILKNPELQMLADLSLLEQVFINLTTNARDAIEATGRGKGKIVVTTRKAGNFAEILYQDDGVGMTEKSVTKAFNPFFTTKEVGKGTGLGLAVCYGIITEHGGRLSVRSNLGVGTTFSIFLPIKS